MTDTSPAAKWPLTLGDPVRAVHYALEWNGDCPYSNPASCPRETEVRDVIDAYRTWLAAHPTSDDRTVIDGQPRESNPVAPHGPHSPSGAPEGPATRERAADGCTAVRGRLEHARDAAALHRQGLLSTAELYAVIEADPAEPPTWIDGDPLMEAIAAAIWERCRTEGTSLVVDDPRTIAAVAAYAIRTTAPDSRTDSPDSEQDSTPDMETDSAGTSADTVRTSQDTSACPQHPGTPVLGGICGACTIHPADTAARRPPMDPVHILGIGAPPADEDAPDDALHQQYTAALEKCRILIPEAQAGAVLAVRDSEMEQLRTELATVQRDLTTSEAARAHLRAQRDQLIQRLGRYADRGIANGERAEQAEAERDQAYRERVHLLAWLAALHPANAVITPADDVDEPGWQLLYLLVGGWQMSWHIHPRDVSLFDHVERVLPDDPRAEWDGHSTTTKYERIQQHVRRLTTDRSPSP
ncbi:hypothetical protein AB0E27_20195 [Streptomyces sparsogenes]|uniref:hypothetical protein n=1 Tax=Streptomyces sparsogenes TaxID=67365 RepID=UPI0033D2F682